MIKNQEQLLIEIEKIRIEKGFSKNFLSKNAFTSRARYNEIQTMHKNGLSFSVGSLCCFIETMGFLLCVNGNVVSGSNAKSVVIYELSKIGVMQHHLVMNNVMPKTTANRLFIDEKSPKFLLNTFFKALNFIDAKIEIKEKAEMGY